MKKNRMAQTCANGISKIASGKVTKVKPGPSLATFEIETPMFFDKKPNIAAGYKVHLGVVRKLKL